MTSPRPLDPHLLARLPQNPKTLQALGVLTPDGSPTLAGALCLAHHQTREHPAHWLHVLRYTSGLAEHSARPGPPLEETWLGPPITQAIDDLAAELALASPLPGRDPEPSRLLFTELLVNAVGHRSYAEPHLQRSVEVRRFTDRVIIASPGALPTQVRLKDGAIEGRWSRNPELMGILGLLGVAHQQGRGHAWARRLAPLLGYRFSCDSSEDEVRAMLTADAALIVGADPRLRATERRQHIPDDVRERSVMRVLGDGFPRTAKQLSKTLDMPGSTVRAVLRRLLAKGLVDRQAASPRSPKQAYRARTPTAQD